MATIKTMISLTDGMTRPLQAMCRGMKSLINAMETAQGSLDHGFDSSTLQQIREDVAEAVVGFDQMEQNISQAGNAQDQFNDSVRNGTTAADSLWNKLKGIAATVGGLAAVKSAISLSDELTNTNARLNLLVDDGGSVEELEQKIMASAQRSRSAYFDTASAVAKLGLNAGSAFGNDMDQVIAFMEQVNKQFVIGGASAQEQSNAMVQLTQAMAAGALRGEELNSILDYAPGIARAIEQYMGIAEGSIKSVAEEGLVTADVVKNALFAAAEETNAEFESMPMTWSQIWTSMQNKALSVFNPILTKINEIANSERFTTVTDAIINGLAGVAAIATTVLDLLINGASFVVDNWSWLSPIIYGVAAALGVYYGAQMAANAVDMISNGLHVAMAGAQMIHLAATGSLTTATAGATAAQYGLNAALYASPITWIIILIVALIAVFYAAVAAVNHFAGTSVSATGVICGLFTAALAFIGNLLVTLWNTFVDVFVLIYNLVGGVAVGIGTLFNDPVAGIIQLFYSLADTVLGVLETLASAIDTIFGSNLAGAVSGWRDSLQGWTESTFGVEVWEGIDGDSLKLDRFSYSDAFDFGYSAGEGLEDSVSGLFDFDTWDSMGAGDSLETFDIGNTLDGVYGNTGDTANNTAATADALDISEEDLEYLRDIAEREAINRFTTAEIKIEQNNENHISKDTDLDGIMNAWAADFAEKMNVSEEGVHE